LNRLPDVTRKYTTTEIAEREQMVIKGVVRKLGELSASDQGSTELLTFGFHFFARKMTEAEKIGNNFIQDKSI